MIVTVKILNTRKYIFQTNPGDDFFELAFTSKGFAMIKKTMAMLLCLSSLPAFAGAETGGGGNVRVCFSSPKATHAAVTKPLQRSGYWSEIKSVEVLDLYEAKMPRGTDPVTPVIMRTLKNENAKAFSERVAKRFDNNFPLFAQVIRTGREAFPEAQIVWSQDPILKTSDINPTINYESDYCTIMGMAVQKIVNGKVKIFIDQKLFQHPKHSFQSRNILFLHEYLYQYAREYREHDTSAPTREAVRFAISVVPETSREDEIKESGLSLLSIEEALIDSTFLPSYKDGALHEILKKINSVEDFIEISNAIARLPESQNFRNKIKSLIYVGNESLFGKYGYCRIEEGNEGKEAPIIMVRCLDAVKLEILLTSDPSVLIELKKLHLLLTQFLENEVALHLKSTILPPILEKIKNRMEDLGHSEEFISNYQQTLASTVSSKRFILEHGTVDELVDELFQFQSSLFEKYGDYLRQITSKLVADKPKE